MKRRTEPRDRSAGFTLIELIVVITIIGILATAVVMNLWPEAERARIKRAQADIHTIKTAIKVYRIRYAHLPDTIDDLMSPPETRDGSPAEPLLEEWPIDPWDNDYYYERDSSGYILYSYGPDGEDDGGDDDDISDRSSSEGRAPVEGYLTIPE